MTELWRSSRRRNSTPGRRMARNITQLYADGVSQNRTPFHRRSGLGFSMLAAAAGLPLQSEPDNENCQMKNEGRVLIADDQPDVLEALRLLLKGQGFEIESAPSPVGILAALEARDFDVVLMDLNYTRDTTSGQEGLDLLAKIQSMDSTVPVVVMT